MIAAYWGLRFLSIVEADGSLYPCDFYVGDDYVIGNIADVPIEEALESDRAMAFRSARENPSECRGCRFFGVCHGGCRRDFVLNEEGHVVNRYCNAFRSFFTHAHSRLKYIAKEELFLENI